MCSQKHYYPSPFQVLIEPGPGSQFQAVLCLANRHWSRNMSRIYESLDHLRQLGICWATADGRWDINTVWQEGFDMVDVLKCVHAMHRDLRKSRTVRKEGK